jgi:hypothetical protein
MTRDDISNLTLTNSKGEVMRIHGSGEVMENGASFRFLWTFRDTLNESRWPMNMTLEQITTRLSEIIAPVEILVVAEDGSIIDVDGTITGSAS